ncbi:unnamed protein product [Rotaria sp. Silwood1]|nr:unnamed protein product [Rotaria sp. Silwood1]CAF1069017.1 unnamed protein product [Rotaria sp. Silwood1]CAF4654298.1 unnamed protein product [Rotaria sp. Silwood1]CAF4696524.1 unnamed protein product [Rotaria sp. Silwood1]
MVSESQLVKRFGELSTSQQSVETLSLFLMHHRRQSQTIVHIWAKELVSATPDRKIAFLYVANDVIQHDKRKGGEFVKDFLPMLASAVQHIVSQVDDENIHKTVKRIIQIWSERQIYQPDAIKLLKTSYENGIQKKESDDEDDDDPTNGHGKRKRTDPSSTSTNNSKRRRKLKRKLSLREEIRRDLAINPIPVPAVDELVKMLQELENSPSSDADVREKIAALPIEVSDSNLLKNLRDKQEATDLYKLVQMAHGLLEEYNLRLESELRSRRYAAKMLQGYIQAQDRQIEHEEKLLEDYKNKLSKLNLIREEIEKHRKNLPQDVNNIQVPPLPSAGDLFAR